MWSGTRFAPRTAAGVSRAITTTTSASAVRCRQESELRRGEYETRGGPLRVILSRSRAEWTVSLCLYVATRQGVRPTQEVRDQRALVAQRSKMMRLATQARNRLHAVLHRHHLAPPEGDPFAQGTEEWWLDLEVSELQRVLIQSDLDTLAYARTQIASLEEAMTAHAAQDERVVLLLQLPGVGLVTAITLLAAIGDINRFASAKQLVGYAGLGSRVHDSGQTLRRGRITKAGRRDIRTVMVEAAHAAARTHQHWRAELARLEPRLGRNKAIVAIARKLLVAVWHVLSKGCADRFADPTQVARMLFNHAYRLGRANRSPGQTTAQYVREQLDRLNLGAELMEIPWGKKTPIALPPSGLL
jgi:transposase